MSAEAPAPRVEPDRVVVIGGGPIGAATARRLADGTRQVVLVDVGPRERAGHRAAGMLAPTSEFRSTEPEVHTACARALQAWPQEAAALEAESGIDLDLRTAGTLHVALGADDLARTEHLAQAARRAGLAPEPLDRRGLRRREPGLSRRVTGGLAVPDDRQVDPRRLVAALHAACRRRGVEVLSDRARVAPDGVVELGSGERIAAGTVVVCAGARTDGVLPPTVPTTGTRPVAGTVLRLYGSATAPVPRHVLRGRVQDREVYLVPRTDGELVIGATTVERGFDERVPAGEVLDLLADAAELYPAVREMHLAESLAGWRPTGHHALPAVADHRLASGTRLLLVTGHGRHGIVLCHQAAADVAERLRQEPTPTSTVPENDQEAP
ncbi:glycine oxidase ThiO [Kytococcus sp. Marseille-QA3725]